MEILNTAYKEDKREGREKKQVNPEKDEDSIHVEGMAKLVVRDRRILLGKADWRDLHAQMLPSFAPSAREHQYPGLCI